MTVLLFLTLSFSSENAMALQVYTECDSLSSTAHTQNLDGLDKDAAGWDQRMNKLRSKVTEAENVCAKADPKLKEAMRSQRIPALQNEAEELDKQAQSLVYQLMNVGSALMNLQNDGPSLACQGGLNKDTKTIPRRMKEMKQDIHAACH